MWAQLIDQRKNSFMWLRAGFLITTAETHIPVEVVIAYIFPCISLQSDTDQTGGHNSALNRPRGKSWHSPWGVEILLHIFFLNKVNFFWNLVLVLTVFNNPFLTVLKLSHKTSILRTIVLVVVFSTRSEGNLIDFLCRSLFVYLIFSRVMAVITFHGKHTAYFLTNRCPNFILTWRCQISVLGGKWLERPTSSGRKVGERGLIVWLVNRITEIYQETQFLTRRPDLLLKTREWQSPWKQILSNIRLH